MSLDFYLYVEVDTGGAELHNVELFWKNITHNLGPMAVRCGLYRPLWRPDEMDDIQKAGDLLPYLEEGLAKLQSDPKHYRQWNPENGWGSYGTLVTFTSAVINACREHPKALIRASV